MATCRCGTKVIRTKPKAKVPAPRVARGKLPNSRATKGTDKASKKASDLSKKLSDQNRKRATKAAKAKAKPCQCTK